MILARDVEAIVIIIMRRTTSKRSNGIQVVQIHVVVAEKE